MNNIHLTIKFGFNFPLKSMYVLETAVYKTTKRNLQKRYIRKTDQQLYLHHKSELPESLKCSIPFVQALRIEWIYTSQDDFYQNCNKLKWKPTERGYKEEEIDENIKKACNIERNEALKERTSKYTNRIPSFLTYNQTVPNFRMKSTKIGHVLVRMHLNL